MRLTLKSAWIGIKSLIPQNIGNEFISIKQAWDNQNDGTWPVDRIFSQGSVTLPSKIVTAAYSLSDIDFLVMANTTSSFTVTLPDATKIGGRLYVVMNTGSKLLTIATVLSQTINGGTSLFIPSQYFHAQLFSDGANWVAI